MTENGKIRWTDKQTAAFVQAYREHECLRNTKCAAYSKIDVRDKALNSMVNTLKE